MTKITKAIVSKMSEKEKTLYARSQEIDFGELSLEQFQDATIQKIIAASIGKENVDLSSGNAATFDDDTPEGTYDEEQFVCTGKNLSIPYSDDSGDFKPFVLVEGDLNLDKVFKGSTAMSPLDYKDTLPQAGDTLPIRVRRNAAGQIRSSAVIK